MPMMIHDLPAAGGIKCRDDQGVALHHSPSFLRAENVFSYLSKLVLIVAMNSLIFCGVATTRATHTASTFFSFSISRFASSSASLRITGGHTSKKARMK